MQRNRRLLVCRVAFLLTLGFALAACGGDSSENSNADASENNSSDANVDSNREGYQWRKSLTTLEINPDSDPSVNGNMEIDPAEVEVQFTTVLAVRPNNDSGEEEEVPVLDGTVRIGYGEEGATLDEDFEWIELTHQGEGVYSGSARGVAEVYRATAEAPGIKPAINTVSSPPIARILSPVHGESYPRRRALPISFEPIDSGTIVEALLNGQMLSRGTSTAEREALSISAAWLQDAADNQAIGIKLRGGSFAVRGDGQSYLEIIVLREVNVNIR